MLSYNKVSIKKVEQRVTLDEAVGKLDFGALKFECSDCSDEDNFCGGRHFNRTLDSPGLKSSKKSKSRKMGTSFESHGKKVSVSNMDAKSKSGDKSKSVLEMPAQSLQEQTMSQAPKEFEISLDVDSSKPLGELPRTQTEDLRVSKVATSTF